MGYVSKTQQSRVVRTDVVIVANVRYIGIELYKSLRCIIPIVYHDPLVVE